jgi:hypothetical protein
MTMQKLLVFQSLWAMERRHTDGVERTLEENLEMIRAAGYDGVSFSLSAPHTPAGQAHARRVATLARELGLATEWQCFPKTVDDLKPVLDLASGFELHHLDIQPDVRPRELKEAVRLVDGWRRLITQVDVDVLIETHRDRLTTDLYATLDLLDCFPDLRLLGDLSHFLVGREFAWPVSDENHAYMHRILDHSWAFHGRVASREQVQIEVSFACHQPWVELFKGWWRHGFRSWRQRAGADDTLAFVCELGPKPYAIVGADGNDLSDRWQDALLLRRIAQELWAEVSAET